MESVGGGGRVVESVVPLGVEVGRVVESVVPWRWGGWWRVWFLGGGEGGGECGSSRGGI